MNRTTVTITLSYLSREGPALSPDEIGTEVTSYLNYSHFLGRDYIGRDFQLESARVLENAPNE